jgi:hypothetical protein
MQAIQAAGAALVAAIAATPPPVVTQASTGKTLTLAVGKKGVLRLSERWTWSAPKVTGDSIRLVRVYYDRDPGFREWSILARSTGNAVIRSTGQPGTKRFVLYVRVR